MERWKGTRRHTVQTAVCGEYIEQITSLLRVCSEKDSLSWEKHAQHHHESRSFAPSLFIHVLKCMLFLLYASALGNWQKIRNKNRDRKTLREKSQSMQHSLFISKGKNIGVVTISTLIYQLIGRILTQLSQQLLDGLTLTNRQSHPSQDEL